MTEVGAIIMLIAFLISTLGSIIVCEIFSEEAALVTIGVGLLLFFSPLIWNAIFISEDETSEQYVIQQMAVDGQYLVLVTPDGEEHILDKRYVTVICDEKCENNYFVHYKSIKHSPMEEIHLNPQAYTDYEEYISKGPEYLIVK